MPSEANERSSGSWLRRAVIGRKPKVTLARIVILAVTCLVVFKFILLPARVEGISMAPTYRNDSFNFINQLAYFFHEPQRGDVVGIIGPHLEEGRKIFHTPGVMYLKRVVGLPGETISFSGGTLFVNGQPLAEPYLKNPCDWTVAAVSNEPGQYYVVGDNRSMPPQDHSHGRIERGQIIGKALF
jgi:signal peptidase I